MACTAATASPQEPGRGKTTLPAPAPLTPAQRQRIEELVAHLIELLDAADGDPDLEPYLASSITDLEDDDADREPSLGWSITYATSPQDSQYGRYDLEEEHDGREPDADEEPWNVPLCLDGKAL